MYVKRFDKERRKIVKAIMLMYDTMTRNFLPNYGCDVTKMPNFERLAEKTVTFDEFYGGSMPCMPARRELHTGKYNFLHRGWGPIEPFDVSMVETLKKNGIYTHLVTDHNHYWEDGGATYHSRYNTFEFFRGQEGDRWVPQWHADYSLNTCTLNKKNESSIQHLSNRTRILKEEDMPSVKTVSAGIDFIESFKEKDNWFLQIECFDPHEPFLVPDKYRELYDCCDAHEAFNFPAYSFVDGKYTSSQIKELRKEYCSLLSMCDAQLGRLLDVLDKYDMWNDTMLIVNTDHGFFLGEHNFIGKNIPPMYDEVIHIPFFIYDPRNKIHGQRRKSLAQTIDLAPTLLNYFGIEQLNNIDGRDLLPVIQNDKPIHEDILFGIHGGQINIYDGKYCYMKSSVKKDLPVYNMTLMPTLMRGFISCTEINNAIFVNGGNYANNNMVLQIPCNHPQGAFIHFDDALYDKEIDPHQMHPLENEVIRSEMNSKLEKAMKRAGAPKWQFERMGFK